ncbi:GDP-mannose 4,6-dehydratase, partial [bacterium]|nr:GDP-mannose 4,6-dehydratase [bacterium]
DKALTVFGKGTQTRSFCYISDLAEGIYRLLLSGVNTPVNIGNPAEMTILDFAKQVIQITESKSKIIFKPLPVDDPRVRRPDISKAKKELNWESVVDIQQGIRSTVEFFRNKA